MFDLMWIRWWKKRKRRGLHGKNVYLFCARWWPVSLIVWGVEITPWLLAREKERPQGVWKCSIVAAIVLKLSGLKASCPLASSALSLMDTSWYNPTVQFSCFFFHSFLFPSSPRCFIIIVSCHTLYFFFFHGFCILYNRLIVVTFPRMVYQSQVRTYAYARSTSASWVKKYKQ